EQDADGLTKITTDTYQYQKLDAAAGSELSGSTLVIKAGDDVTIQASSAAADQDITISGDNVTIQAAEENSSNEYRESVKKTGFSLSFDGGLNV
ncbi:hemagglutinin repeat-containing protein, partial [Acetonema longum]